MDKSKFKPVLFKVVKPGVNIVRDRGGEVVRVIKISKHDSFVWARDEEEFEMLGNSTATVPASDAEKKAYLKKSNG